MWVNRERLMPRFYFHLRGPAGRDDDDIGLDLAGMEAAYLEAYRAIPALSAELAYEKTCPTRYTFEITDAGGNLLMEVPFSEVLDRGRRPIPPTSASTFRKAAAEMERTADLIGSINEERVALRATLTETRQLQTLSRQVGRMRP
jgi:hypothetical protein